MPPEKARWHSFLPPQTARFLVDADGRLPGRHILCSRQYRKDKKTPSDAYIRQGESVLLRDGQPNSRCTTSLPRLCTVVRCLMNNPLAEYDTAPVLSSIALRTVVRGRDVARAVNTFFSAVPFVGRMLWLTI